LWRKTNKAWILNALSTSSKFHRKIAIDTNPSDLTIVWYRLVDHSADLLQHALIISERWSGASS